MEEKVEVLDQFTQKLTRGGHKLVTIRKILVNGIKFHERKVKRCKKECKPVHRSVVESSKARKSKKLSAKSNWFRRSS